MVLPAPSSSECWKNWRGWGFTGHTRTFFAPTSAPAFFGAGPGGYCAMNRSFCVAT